MIKCIPSMSSAVPLTTFHFPLRVTQTVQGRRRFDFLSVIRTGVHHSIELHRHADAAGTIGGCGEIHGRILSALCEEEMRRVARMIKSAHAQRKVQSHQNCLCLHRIQTISHKIAAIRSGFFFLFLAKAWIEQNIKKGVGSQQAEFQFDWTLPLITITPLPTSTDEPKQKKKFSTSLKFHLESI